MGVNLRITTKYWMEQMGLPFHPTHINRAEPARSPAQLCRPAPLPAALQDALAALERRHGADPAVGRSGVCAAVCRKHASLRRRRLRGERAVGHQDGGPAARPEAVRAAESRSIVITITSSSATGISSRCSAGSATTPARRRRCGSGNSSDASARKPRRMSESGLHRASWVLPRIVAACYPYSTSP